MVTHQCNLQCTYCYEKHKDGNRINLEKAKQYLSEAYKETISLPQYNAIEISFMGGEPLLEFDLIRALSEWIWTQDWKLPFIIFISTNGTLLTEERKKWFYENREKVVLGISVDGAPISQSMNRGKVATKVDYDFFIDTWPNQGIKCTISRETLPTLAEDVVWLHEKGFKKIYGNLAFGIDWQASDLNVYITQLHLLSDYYFEHPETQRCSLIDIDLPSAFDFSKSVPKYCGCGEGTVLIDVDGHKYPCPVFSPITMSNEQLAGIRVIDFSNDDCFLEEKCRPCVLHNACPKCYATNYLMTGSVASQSPFLCNAFKLQFIANCEFHEKMIQHCKEEPSEQLSRALELAYLIFKKYN